MTIGTVLGISTLAAAALGNTISDLAGIGSAWYVESAAEKIGVRAPPLTPQQLGSSGARWSANAVSSLLTISAEWLVLQIRTISATN